MQSCNNRKYDENNLKGLPCNIHCSAQKQIFVKTEVLTEGRRED